MDSGDLIDLDITGVAHGGVFVGRHEGRVVFVPDTMPGERVRVRLTDVRKKSFWRGDVVEVLDASPHRQAHIWRQADVDVPPEQRPGGADFGHIVPQQQRALKLDVLRDALQRFGGLDLPVEIEQARPILSPEGDVVAQESPAGTGWRTRVSLHVDDEGRVGPYAARSHTVIPVEDLPLGTAEIERAALAVGRGEAGRIDLVQPADGRVRVLRRPERGRRDGRDPGHETIIERVDGRDFRVDAGGFWQVHRLAAHSLTELVTEAVRAAHPDQPTIDPDAWHLDLYGGVGLFGATLAALAGPGARVTSVESDPRATEYAGENLAEWIGARAETGRVDRWVSALSAGASAVQRERLSRGVVLLDPPRAGAGRVVVEAVADLEPDTIVYVACDPVALARDLATFRDVGYDTRAVTALDIFPSSHHVEAVASLTRTHVPRLG